MLFRSHLKEVLSVSSKALLKLTTLERSVMSEVYFKEKPITEVARSLGYSRSHISRIRNLAVSKLKRNPTLQNLMAIQ